MFSKKKATLAVTGIGVAAAMIIAGSVTAALAAGPGGSPDGSSGPYYLVSANDLSQIPAGTTNAWTAEVVGSPNPADQNAVFGCPADATTVRTFISPRGQEATPASWSAFAVGGFAPSTKNVLFPEANLSAQISGAPASVKAAGGNYSLGVACMLNASNVASTGIWFTHIVVTAATGAWTFDTPEGEGEPDPCVVNPGSCLTGDIALEAETLAAQDGALSLVVAAGATASIGDPELVNGISTSTGELPEFQVIDQRVVSHPGWELTYTVAPFVNSSDVSEIIDAEQLGLVPAIVSTTADGVTAAGGQTAGSAAFPADFASATNAAQVGTTVLSGDLTFVAPVGYSAGTYTSTLTLTLVG
jgi:hypothetical protein